MKKYILTVLASLAMSITRTAGQLPTETSLPRLERKGNTAHIVVNDRPMLMIGGELGNSSASTLHDVQQHFAHLHRMGLNTVLAPVTWELIEPQEGHFDMTSLDDILAEARKNELKVVLLWFGAWKNSMSCYAPEWFKRDTKRFPRAHTMDGKPVEEASSLSKNVLEADKRAFCKMMQHLRDHDTEHTVIMIQVENEIGMIEVPRDYSSDATKLYESSVPKSLTDYLHTNKKSLHPYIADKMKTTSNVHPNWVELFGDDIYTEEIFQTWTYATYVQQLAEAGRSIYNLPMYVNVALNSRNRQPGQYPSGGPLAHLIDIWHAAAPAIDVLGVDIYDKGFADWVAKYHLHNNPLFIPEIRLEDKDAMYALYAFGHHSAMGFCPFSIEDYPLLSDHANANDTSDLDLSQDDQLNAFSAQQSRLSPLAACYRLLRQVEPLIIQRQGTQDMEGVLLTNDQRQQDIITPDGIRLTVKHSYSLGWEPGARDPEWPEAACIILRLAKDDYLVIGSGVVLTYTDAASNKSLSTRDANTWQKGDKRIGLAKCELVDIENGQIKIKRHLNGDQTHQGRHVRIPVGQFEMQHFRLYKY